MSYNISLSCGCDVYVSCHPVTGLAHSRIIERRGERCRIRQHAVGRRLALWELLPPPEATAVAVWVSEEDPPKWP